MEERAVSTPQMEAAVSALHEALARAAPSLLPLLRAVVDEAQAEQTRHVAQKAKLLRLVYGAR